MVAMRIAISAVGALSILLMSGLVGAKAGPMIETGRQLSIACAAYLKKNVRENENILIKRDACKEYLAGFVAAYGVGRDTELTSEIEGTGSSESDAMPCFKFPDYLSFSDFARLIVDFVNVHPEYGSKPAFQAAAASLAAKYPCR